MSKTVTEDLLSAQLSRTIGVTHFDRGKRTQGKVRDSYVEGDRRFLVATDRLSAFDVVLTTIPFKGQVLNQMAAYWFEQTKEIAPNHLIDVPDPNVTVCVECEPLPIEMVVRGYLTGSSATSAWTAYASGQRIFFGHRLPDAMQKHQKLVRPLLTPTTKGEQGEHDRSLDKGEEVDLVGRKDFDAIADLSLTLFKRGVEIAEERGLILVDTKYEFGRAPDGQILVMDEVHTPDSSRYWYSSGYQEAFERGDDPRAIDKEYVRRYLVAQGYRGEGKAPAIDDEVRVEAARRYIEVFEQLTGTAFQCNTEEPLARIERNLSK